MEKKEESKPRERAQGTVSDRFGGFPVKLWVDWATNCQEEYGGCYWIKMWDDHRKARELGLYDHLLSELNTMKRKINELEKKKPDEKVKTFNAEFE